MLFPHKGGVTPWSLRAFSNPGPLGMIKNNILLDILKEDIALQAQNFMKKVPTLGNFVWRSKYFFKIFCF
jgi:hypothetical protein